MPDLGSEDEKPVKKPTMDSKKQVSKKVQSDDEVEGDEGEDGDEEDEEEEDESMHEADDNAISASEDEDADEDAIGRLNDFVSGLATTGTKRKAGEGGEDEDVANASSSAQAKKRKKHLKDRTEGGVESEFGARAAGL